jgi:hypothetical protein
MRVAKVISWIVLAFYVVSALTTRESLAVRVGQFLVMFPAAAALLIYHSQARRWLWWFAVVGNSIYAVLGGLLFIAVLVGMAGVSSLAVGNPALVLAIAVLLLLAPGVINVYALWRRRVNEGTSSSAS